MQVKHEPREAFVEQLERRVASEARRRNDLQPPVRWVIRSPARFAAAIVGIVAISMAAGGAAVDAAYRSQQNERRALILAAYLAKEQIAQVQMRIAKEELERVKRNVDVGMATEIDLLEGEQKMRSAEAALKKTQLEIEEIRVSGAEPVNSLTAALVGGRDFVTDRWLVELEVSQGVLEIERRRQRAAQRRFEVGLADAQDIEVISARAHEAEATLNWFRERIEIRKRFVRKEIDATEAELSGLEAETLSRFLALTLQLEMARRTLAAAEIRLKKGQIDSVDVAKARLAVMSLEADVARVQLDRELIQKRRRGRN